MIIHRRTGVTLIEVLVTLGIISLLLSFVIPAVQQVRASAARNQCANNLRQIALGLHAYHDAIGALPPALDFNLNAKHRFLHWHARILPYVDQAPLWQASLDAYAADPNPFHIPPHNNHSIPVAIFQCPADSRRTIHTPDGIFAPTAYLGNSGLSYSSRTGVLFLLSAIRFADITDGTSSTLLVGERPVSDFLPSSWYAHPGIHGNGGTTSHMGVRELHDDDRVSYSCPAPAHFEPATPRSPCGYTHFWSLHPLGAHFAFADGSVHFLRYSADIVLPALSTRNGGEVVGAYE